MKRLLPIIFLIFSFSNASADTCTAIVDGGDWSDPATWSCGHIPTHGDVMIIPAGFTVNVDCNCGVYVNMQIEIYGELHFNNGQKIDLDAAGVVQVHAGGIVTGGNGGSKIIINGTPLWDGGDPDVVGPSYIADGIPPTSGYLSVTLVEFNAIVNDRTVEITWTTNSEINNDYFVVERSQDGLLWSSVITAKGAGNSTGIISYFEIDREPLIGLSYYRLRQVDFDGKGEEFNIVPIEIFIQNDEVMSVFPNPARKGEVINVSFKNLGSDASEDKEVLVVLRDIRGNEMYSKVEFVNSKEGLVAIDKTHHLTPGTYLVIASSENKLYSKRILIK